MDKKKSSTFIRLFISGFWATVCKTVRPTLSDRCLSVLSCPFCNVCVLWPNSWMDQDETWHVGSPALC